MKWVSSFPTKKKEVLNVSVFENARVEFGVWGKIEAGLSGAAATDLEVLCNGFPWWKNSPF